MSFRQSSNTTTGPLTYHDLSALRDPMIYLSGLGQFLFDICLYGFVSWPRISSILRSPDLTASGLVQLQSTFLVVIINQLGFGRIESQAMTAPVYFRESSSLANLVSKSHQLCHLLSRCGCIPCWSVGFRQVLRPMGSHAADGMCLGGGLRALMCLSQQLGQAVRLLFMWRRNLHLCRVALYVDWA